MSTLTASKLLMIRITGQDNIRLHQKLSALGVLNRIFLNSGSKRIMTNDFGSIGEPIETTQKRVRLAAAPVKGQGGMPPRAPPPRGRRGPHHWPPGPRPPNNRGHRPRTTGYSTQQQSPTKNKKKEQTRTNKQKHLRTPPRQFTDVIPLDSSPT